MFNAARFVTGEKPAGSQPGSPCRSEAPIGEEGAGLDLGDGEVDGRPDDELVARHEGPGRVDDVPYEPDRRVDLEVDDHHVEWHEAPNASRTGGWTTANDEIVPTGSTASHVASNERQRAHIGRRELQPLAAGASLHPQLGLGEPLLEGCAQVVDLRAEEGRAGHDRSTSVLVDTASPDVTRQVSVRSTWAVDVARSCRTPWLIRLNPCT